MSSAAPSVRTVLILGTGALGNVIGFVERAARLGGELVLLSLGYPVSDEQRSTVAQAIVLVAETPTSLDAVLVPDVGDLPRHLLPDDSIAVFATGLERRTIERAVRRAFAQDSAIGGRSSPTRGSGFSRRATSAS